MEDFEYKSLIEKRKMTIEELKKYYQELRKYEYMIDAPEKGIEIRKRLNKLVVLLMRIERTFLGHSLTIIGDERIKNDKPKIYAVTHIGRYDIETVIEATKENAYFIWGDPNELYKSPEMLLLQMIGMIFVDTDNKEDRHISLERAIKVLKSGGNILIYPEGAWNLSENEIVMQLYTGAVVAAIRGGAEIIPVGIEHYGKDYYVNIGRNIDYSNVLLENARAASDDLRDILSTLKWEIWEKYGYIDRKSLPENYSEIFLKEIMKESDNGYTIEEIERTRFKDKRIILPEDVYAHLAYLNINHANAFLLNGLTDIERERQAKLLKKMI